MLSSYPACFLKERNGYSVIFPDLNYLATCGESLDEAQVMAADCLAGYLHSMQEDGETVPPASHPEKIDLPRFLKELEVEDVENAFIGVVTVDAAEYAKRHFEESVKRTLTLPAWLNAMAEENHIDLSQTLQNALKEQLGAV